MSAQEVLAFGLGALALAYLAWRGLRRRASGNCCGEPECPAAKQMVERVKRS